jgi:DNA-binding GntR family transcriptional regulator
MPLEEQVRLLSMVSILEPLSPDPARLASQILRLLESEGVVTGEGRYRIPTRYTHEQLATMIGSKRVPVTRAFRKLEEAGAVELKARHVYVIDHEALKRAAEAE